MAGGFYTNRKPETEQDDRHYPNTPGLLRSQCRLLDADGDRRVTLFRHAWGIMEGYVSRADSIALPSNPKCLLARNGITNIATYWSEWFGGGWGAELSDFASHMALRTFPHECRFYVSITPFASREPTDVIAPRNDCFVVDSAFFVSARSRKWGLSTCGSSTWGNSFRTGCRDVIPVI